MLYDCTLMEKKKEKKKSDVDKVSLIEEGNKIGINEVIKRNEIINNGLK